MVHQRSRICTSISLSFAFLNGVRLYDFNCVENVNQRYARLMVILFLAKSILKCVGSVKPILVERLINCYIIVRKTILNYIATHICAATCGVLVL